MSLINVSN